MVDMAPDKNIYLHMCRECGEYKYEDQQCGSCYERTQIVSNLNNCPNPKCNSTNIHCFGDDNSAMVECADCHCHVTRETREAAIDMWNSAWNTRAGEGEDKAVRWAVTYGNKPVSIHADRYDANVELERIHGVAMNSGCKPDDFHKIYTIAQFELREITAPREDGE